jgi:hypothetical protein
MAPFGSDWGIIADLGYDNSTLRDEIDKFGALVKKLNMSTYCFFEQFKTDYGKRFGVPGIIKGMVSRHKRPFKSERLLTPSRSSKRRQLVFRHGQGHPYRRII